MLLNLTKVGINGLSGKFSMGLYYQSANGE